MFARIHTFFPARCNVCADKQECAERAAQHVVRHIRWKPVSARWDCTKTRSGGGGLATIEGTIKGAGVEQCGETRGAVAGHRGINRCDASRGLDVQNGASLMGRYGWQALPEEPRREAGREAAGQSNVCRGGSYGCLPGQESKLCIRQQLRRQLRPQAGPADVVKQGQRAQRWRRGRRCRRCRQAAVGKARGGGDGPWAQGAVGRWCRGASCGNGVWWGGAGGSYV